MDSAAQKPLCPRCGYDQSGAIAAWERIDPPSCPLSTTCTECGLDFAWRDLLNPIYSRQLTMFEHAQLRRPTSFLSTWWRAARPWSFWSWLRMEHRIVPRRIAGFAACGFLFTHILLILFSAAVAIAMKLALSLAPRPMWLYDSALSAAGHAAYPLGSDWSYAGPHSSISRAIAPLEMVSFLTVLLVPFTFALLPVTLRRARVRRGHLARIWAYSLAWIPLAFGASGLVVQVLKILDFIGRMLGKSWPWFSITIDHLRLRGAWITLAAAGIWSALWWSLAARRYLRLPHATAIGLVMTALAMLLVTLTLFIFPGGTWLTWDF